MKLFRVYEKIWLLAAAIALGIAIYNLIVFKHFDHLVYFPVFCAVFCVIVFFNKRSYRRFYERMEAERKKEMKP